MSGAVVKPDKFILDATAGFRMMWFNKREPHTIYLDQRPECEPDIVGDFRDLKQFPDETFKLIVFDPPFFKQRKHTLPWIERDYGKGLQPETWQSDIKQAFKELWRVLKPDGLLIFKWGDDRIRVKHLYSLFPVKPLFGQTTTGGKCAKTYWFCFMKITECVPKPLINELGINSEANGNSVKFPSEAKKP